MCTCVRASFPISSSAGYSSSILFFLAPFFAIPVRLQEAGWDASKGGGMCYHSNKLTHGQDCTIFYDATGVQQQMYPLVLTGFLDLWLE